jgi:hypothetical protein
MGHLAPCSRRYLRFWERVEGVLSEVITPFAVRLSERLNCFDHVNKLADIRPLKMR